MAYSYEQYPADGSTRIFPITCPYLSRDHIRVRINGVDVDFEFLTDTTIKLGQLVATPTTPSVVEIRRITPVGDRLIDFQDGSTLEERDLDVQFNQMLYMTQEAYDRLGTLIELSSAGTFNALGKRLSNLSEGVDDTDGVTVGQLRPFVEAAKLYQDVAAAARDQSVAARDLAVAASQIAVGARDAAQLAVGGVRVSNADTFAAPLSAKLGVAGLATKTITNPGASEVLTLSVPVATKAAAEAGTGSGVMTPELTAQAIAALVPAPTYSLIGAADTRASLAAAAATLTVTASQVVAGAGLAGGRKLLTGYSQTVTLATTGAGGMDTGAAPVSGFVALYAIAKADGTASILACNATTSSGPAYAGANMPTGYTYSALLAIVPTNTSGQFPVLSVMDRTCYIPDVYVVSNVAAASYTAVSLTAAVPPTAKVALFVAYTGVTNSQITISSDAAGSLIRSSDCITTNQYPQMMHSSIPLVTPQKFYYRTSYSGGGTIDVYGYTF